jgi:mersacidin/lichenicidin family type 2 lantibiotic
MSQATDAKAREVIMRAWRDDEYRKSLPAEVQEKLPPAPEGAAQMSDQELETAAGAGTPLVAVAAIGSVAVGYGVSEIVD